MFLLFYFATNKVFFAIVLSEIGNNDNLEEDDTTESDVLVDDMDEYN